jgi:hypothetical protein
VMTPTVIADDPARLLRGCPSVERRYLARPVLEPLRVHPKRISHQNGFRMDTLSRRLKQTGVQETREVNGGSNESPNSFFTGKGIADFDLSNVPKNEFILAIPSEIGMTQAQAFVSNGDTDTTSDLNRYPNDWECGVVPVPLADRYEDDPTSNASIMFRPVRPDETIDDTDTFYFPHSNRFHLQPRTTSDTRRLFES